MSAQKLQQQESVKVTPAQVITCVHATFKPVPGSDSRGRWVWNSWGGEGTATAGQTGKNPSGLWASCRRHSSSPTALFPYFKHTLWRILHPFIKRPLEMQLCLVRKACQHKKKDMGENWTHEKMLHQTQVSLALVIYTAIAYPIC